MKETWTVFILIALVSVSCTLVDKKEEGQNAIPSTPNIIYILVDDLGYGDLGKYGQQILKTPAIDQLADQGMVFNRHYAGSTVCAPSRCSLMTGKHIGHCSVRGNQPDGMLIRDEEITIAEVLQDAGYYTAMEGK